MNFWFLDIKVIALELIWICNGLLLFGNLCKKQFFINLDLLVNLLKRRFTWSIMQNDSQNFIFEILEQLIIVVYDSFCAQEVFFVSYWWRFMRFRYGILIKQLVSMGIMWYLLLGIKTFQIFGPLIIGFKHLEIKLHFCTATQGIRIFLRHG